MEATFEPHHIIHRVDTAFGSVPYPGEDLLLKHDCPAARRLRDGLRGRPPGAVPEEVVEQHCDGLALLTAEARRYYLPAWVRTALRRPGSDVAEFVLYTLAGDLRWQLEGGFSRAQREAVVTLLEFLPLVMDRIFHAQIAAALARWQALVPFRRFGCPGEAGEGPSAGPAARFYRNDLPTHLEYLELPVHPDQLERLERHGGLAPEQQRIFG